MRAAWVHGSIARGDADAVSDLDVIVAVADADAAAFADGWRPRLASITPTVMARPSFGHTGSWLAITPACLRFDLWVETVSQVATSPVRDRLVLFDRDGLAALVPPAPPDAPPSAERRAELRRRFVGAAAVARVADDLLMHQAIWTLRLILYESFVESNRPLPPTGLKRWSAKLSAAQRATLESLPTAGDPTTVIAALADEVGPLPESLPDPDLRDVVVPPEGVVRGLDLLTVPSAERARHVAEEFFALHLYLALIVHRRDWLLGVVGANDSRRTLYELLLDHNGRRPATSPADWSGRLTADQRAELLSLPEPRPTRDSVVAAHLAGRELVERVGRVVAGTQWPVDLEGAVTPYVNAAIARAGGDPLGRPTS